MDIEEEIKKLLDNSSKGFLSVIKRAIVFTLAIGALGGVTSSIVTIRGMVRDGLNLYQNYFVCPAIFAGGYLGLHYSPAEINTATLGSISVAAIVRISLQGESVAYQEINRIYSTDLKPRAWIIYTSHYLGSICMWIYYGLTDYQAELWKQLILFFCAPAIIVIGKWLASKTGGSFYERGKFNYFLSYYRFLAIVSFTLLVLIAVSNGITEVLPQ